MTARQRVVELLERGKNALERPPRQPRPRVEDGAAQRQLSLTWDALEAQGHPHEPLTGELQGVVDEHVEDLLDAVGVASDSLRQTAVDVELEGHAARVRLASMAGEHVDQQQLEIEGASHEPELARLRAAVVEDIVDRADQVERRLFAGGEGAAALTVHAPRVEQL